MFAPLALTLLTAALPPASRTDDPPIRLKLSEENYSRGDRAKVKVRAADDGYLLVLRADADGRVRILFPLQPDDNAQITGGKDFEVRSRGDREAFVVDDGSGSGAVLAVWSDQPFRFDDFNRNGHWDYRALSDQKITGDRESGLLDLVDKMTDGKYEYDVAQYTVDEPGYVRHYSAGFYSPWWDGFYGPCYGCYYGPRWRVGLSFGFGGYRHFYHGRRRW